MFTSRRSRKNRNSQVTVTTVIALMALLSSCATPSVHSADKHVVNGKPEEPRTAIQFDECARIPLGTSAVEIISRFGRPQTAFALSDGSEFVLVYQNLPTQRVYFAFDPSKKVLTGKTYEPQPDEKVRSLEGVQAYFKGADLYRPPASMCGSHYTMNAGTAFLLGMGVSLAIHPKSQAVQAISWGPVQPKPRTPAQLPNGCPEGPVVMAEEVEDPMSLLR